MDQSEMAQIIQQKQENPRLIREPLDLGQNFINFADSNNEIQINNPLTACPVLLLFFGAEWCNITKPFVSELKKHYDEINLQKKNVQIIYVSLDKAKKQFDNITKKFPWLGISFDDARVKGLRQFYNIRSIPTLVLTDKSGQNLGNVRQDIYSMKEDDAFEKWNKTRAGEEIMEEKYEQQKEQ